MILGTLLLCPRPHFALWVLTLNPFGGAHNRDHLRGDYKFNVAIADRFGKDWVAFYIPTLQGRNKWRETTKNLQIGKFVLEGDFADIFERGKYRVGRVAEVFPQMHHGTPLLLRVKIAVTEYDLKTDSYKVVQVYRDISRIAQV